MIHDGSLALWNKALNLHSARDMAMCIPSSQPMPPHDAEIQHVPITNNKLAERHSGYASLIHKRFRV